MNTVLSIVLAIEVTLLVANAVPRAPVKLIKLLPKAKESKLLASMQTKLVVNTRPIVDEEEIILLAESLEKSILSRSENYSSGDFQTITPDLLREPVKTILAKTSLTLPNKIIGEQHVSKGTEALIDGRKEIPLAKSIHGGISDVLTQNPPPDLLDSWSRSYHSKNIYEAVEPFQQVNVLTSPQLLEEENIDDIPNRERILVSDPTYQLSKVFENEFKSILIPNSFIRFKKESIDAPPQDYLIEPGDKSLPVEKYDLTLGEIVPVPNVLAQQAIDALKQESADILKLDSKPYLALECLLPPLDDHKTDHDDLRPSLGLLKESDAEPVKTILNLWESDEYGMLGSDFSKYDEETRTDGNEEGGDNNYDDTNF